MTDEKLSPGQKALQINVDASRYGTFAEIGAGQEVARWFFHVGGASGTVAKTISAYDMAVSDAIYGPADRYVSRKRLRSMLEYEFDLLLQRLDKARGDKTTFFAFANTVATRSFSRKEEGHGWLGIRFQTEPRGLPSEIFIHVRMLDKENARQQEALGIIGVNLIHGAFYKHLNPDALIASLLDSLTWERVEVDLIRFGGPAFAGLDNRLMALQLVKQGLTEAAMFTAEGEAVQWNEVLYKKPVLVQRGSFHPITNATLDVLRTAHEQFVREPDLNGEEPVVLVEMTLRQLTTGDAINERDFLDRADTLIPLGKTVLISNFRRFHRLAAYLARYTARPIGLAMGASKLAEIFDRGYYNDEEGGLIGGLGQLFKNPGRLYIYPILNFKTGQIGTAENFPIAPQYKHLYEHFRANGFIKDIASYNPDVLRIRSADLLDKIKSGDATWEQSVPPQIVEVIKAKKLFGCA
ncbi:MAG TPA: TonB-dependent receptor [Verrucomicrobiota bacterium]|nr:TonB-dependent receptor [Verrucomicrobiota bacterium]